MLSLYRIPGKLEDSASNLSIDKPPVLMIHSQDWDMTQWISNEPDKAQAFALADAGYDVWMGNNRGSAYSLAHTTLSPKSKEYWDFYQFEMGTIDVPTFIDFILGRTGRSQLSYIGHSTGNNQFYMAASLQPKYFSERVNVFISLAPPVFLKNIDAPIAYH